MLKRLTLVMIIQGVIAIPSHAQQCVNHIEPNCDFYNKCLEATCNCGYGASDGYALSYGQKYCKKFLGENSFSAQGKKWRDSTLRCLQEKLVSELPTSSSGCNCANLQSKAYATHVQCYTQDNASICDLPSSDAVAIDHLISDSNKSDAEGIKAI